MLEANRVVLSTIKRRIDGEVDAGFALTRVVKTGSARAAYVLEERPV